MQFLKKHIKRSQQKHVGAAVCMSEMLNLFQQSSPPQKKMDNVCLYFPQVHFLTSL